MSEQPEAIGVIGVGWVGLVTAACFADLGRDVVAIDVDAAKVEALQAGEVTMHEPGIAELLERNAERLTFTTEMGEVLDRCRLLFCCVDTPPTYSGDADLSRVQAVVSQLPEGSGHALVMKSTVPAGTGASIRREHPSLAYISCPEFLKEGSAVEDFLHPDRVVIGGDGEGGWAADAVEELYRPLGGELVRTDVASAEMIKLASNAFLATKISFINEIANVSEEVGADVGEVARGMGLDQRIGDSFLQAGIGYGGSCLIGTETVVARNGRAAPGVRTFESLFAEVAIETDAPLGAEVVYPEDLEVLSWDGESIDFHAVGVLTRRRHWGEVLEVRTKMGRRLRCTPDHPFVVRDAQGGFCRRKLARELTSEDWLPVAVEGPAPGESEARFSFAGGMTSPGLEAEDVIVRPAGREMAAIASLDPPARRVVLGNGDGSVARQTRRIAPAGFRRHGGGVASARVASVSGETFDGFVYSLEVPGPHTVVTTDGLITSNCFPKDVAALKQLAGNTGYHFQLLTSVIEVNELQKRRVLKKLEKHLGSLAGKRIALLGLAFKPNTDDMREASSLVLSARLQGEGAIVAAYDPVAMDRARELLPGVELADSAAAALEGADAAILVTEWAEFAELDWGSLASRMGTPLIVDGRNFLDPGTLRDAGFTYEGIGRQV